MGQFDVTAVHSTFRQSMARGRQLGWLATDQHHPLCHSQYRSKGIPSPSVYLEPAAPIPSPPPVNSAPIPPPQPFFSELGNNPPPPPPPRMHPPPPGVLAPRFGANLPPLRERCCTLFWHFSAVGCRRYWVPYDTRQGPSSWGHEDCQGPAAGRFVVQ
mgnify:CR=1 FL=1